MVAYRSAKERGHHGHHSLRERWPWMTSFYPGSPDHWGELAATSFALGWAVQLMEYL